MAGCSCVEYGLSTGGSLILSGTVVSVMMTHEEDKPPPPKKTPSPLHTRREWLTGLPTSCSSPIMQLISTASYKLGLTSACVSVPPQQVSLAVQGASAGKEEEKS